MKLRGCLVKNSGSVFVFRPPSRSHSPTPTAREPGFLQARGELPQAKGEPKGKSLLYFFDKIDASGQVVGVAIEPGPTGVSTQWVAFVAALLLE